MDGYTQNCIATLEEKRTVKIGQEKTLYGDKNFTQSGNALKNR
jgi:hypothetical protein